MSNLRSVHLTEFTTLEKIFDLLKEALYLTKIIATRARCTCGWVLEDDSAPGIPIVHTFLREIEFRRVRNIGDLLLLFILPNLGSFASDDFFEFEDSESIRGVSACFAGQFDDPYYEEVPFGELVARNLCADIGLLPYLRSLGLYATTYPEDDIYDKGTGNIFADVITSR
ncbi:uncharacterized protein EV420DRAFT_63706 [Desarmillaria tabescens]|uniref:Uncharacterized protein n=1 Tax=Armillaria tabescens TaxID=1929756 RepID=A0AA39NQQ2_ARMTA|nr:uncharacterized protein EV420DRAFT_63706 [Desarmillaria tabescens]KAK0469778.1 hypothetical protein EV420DRAFT_63706 [Desarmillaria tabescens]